jgi:predicted RNA binding protein YcfA (HicA-like mRNA interferase family)
VNPHQPVVSGRLLVRALLADGWFFARQKGSHVLLRKPGRPVPIVVPLHRELKKGTLAGILRDARLTTDDLRRLLG